MTDGKMLADRIERCQPIQMIGATECHDIFLCPEEWKTIVAALRAPVGHADAGREALELAKRAENCLNSRSSAYPSDVLRECISFLRAIYSAPSRLLNYDHPCANLTDVVKPGTTTEQLDKAQFGRVLHERPAFEVNPFANEPAYDPQEPGVDMGESVLENRKTKS